MKPGVLALILAACLCVGTVMADAPPSLDSPEWARGRHSSMHMLLEKTVLKVDVLTVDVRVGKDVHRRFIEVIGKNKQYSEQLGERLAAVALGADDALVQVRYLRKITFGQWMEGVLENLERAEAAKLITPEIRRRVQARLLVVDAGKEPPFVVMASYFAPNGDFREPLLRSLFE